MLNIKRDVKDYYESQADQYSLQKNFESKEPVWSKKGIEFILLWLLL